MSNKLLHTPEEREIAFGVALWIWSQHFGSAILVYFLGNSVDNAEMLVKSGTKKIFYPEAQAMMQAALPVVY